MDRTRHRDEPEASQETAARDWLLYLLVFLAILAAVYVIPVLFAS